MIDIAIALVAASVPGFLIFWHIRRRWRCESSTGFLLSHFSAGCAIAFLALFAELAFKGPLLRLVPANFSFFITAFIIAALIEESVKALGIKAAADRGADQNFPINKAMGACLTVGLGFGVTETCFYALANPETAISLSILRYLSAVPLHYFNGLLFATAYLKKSLGKDSETLWMFFVIVVAHGLYDFVIMRPDAASALAVIVLLSQWGYSRWQLKQLDDA